jgi:hypothetical protein
LNYTRSLQFHENLITSIFESSSMTYTYNRDIKAIAFLTGVPHNRMAAVFRVMILTCRPILVSRGYLLAPFQQMIFTPLIEGTYQRPTNQLMH